MPVASSTDKTLRFGGHTIRLPGSRFKRLMLGVGLLLGGMLWFLPILGLWMFPLGLIVLSVEVPPLRRLADWLKGRRGKFDAETG